MSRSFCGLLSVAFTLTVLIHNQGNAQAGRPGEIPRAYADLSVGAAFSQDQNENLSLRGQLGYRFANTFSLSAFVIDGGSLTESDYQISHYGIGLDILSTNIIKNLILGGLIAYSNETDSEGDENGFSYGPIISYHYPIYERVSVGVDLLPIFNTGIGSELTTYGFVTGRFWF